MDYFWLRQDRRYNNTPVIEGFYEKMRRKDFVLENRFRIPDRNVFFCDNSKKLDFTDIVDHQVYLVSEKVKGVFNMYEKQIVYKCFCLLNNLAGEYKVYYTPLFPVVDCMLKGSLFRGNELILKEEFIGAAGVFKLKYEGMEIVVVRLDVAESLLRRCPDGIELKKLQLR